MSISRKKLSEIAIYISRGISPAYDREGMTVINQRCIRDHRISLEVARLTNPRKRRVAPEKIIQQWDVLVNSTGVGTLGRVAQVRDIIPNSTVDSHVTIVRPDLSEIDGPYFGYVMVYFEPVIEAMGQGATGQTELSRTRLGEEIEIPVPPLHAQRRIAAILSAYDDLIENNTRRIQILEEIAHAIYREWFVNLRFPGHENVSLIDSGTELGEVPVGWKIGSFTEFVEINPKIEIVKEAEKPFVSMSGISTNSMLIEWDEYRSGTSGSKFQNGDVIFPRITPSVEHGKGAYVQFLGEGEVALGSTEFIVFRSEFLPSQYIYFMARDYRFRENAIKSMVGASGRQRVRPECFDAFSLAMPSKDLLASFSTQVQPHFSLVHLLARQTAKVRELRDLLLPRLISGELDVAPI